MLPMDALQGRITGTHFIAGRGVTFGLGVGRSGPKHDLLPGGVKRFVSPGRVRKLDGEGGLYFPAVPQSATRGPARFR